MILYIDFSHSILFGKILRNSSISDQFHFVLGHWNATGWPHTCPNPSCLPCKIENSCQSPVLTICLWYVCHLSLSEKALPINHRGYPRKILVKVEHFSETPFCTAGDWTVLQNFSMIWQLKLGKGNFAKFAKYIKVGLLNSKGPDTMDTNEY